MTANFKRIFQQAEKTFAAINAESFKANFQHLKKLVDVLTLSDINVMLPDSEKYRKEVIISAD